jgi:hypothetical protein
VSKPDSTEILYYGRVLAMEAEISGKLGNFDNALEIVE